MKAVGGYFELELNKGMHYWHEVPYAFKSGRSSLHSILRQCKPSLVHVPFYTCDALLQAFEAAQVPYRFYAINEMLNPVKLVALKSDEYLLYINYFGLKSNQVNQLSAMYGARLIVDCTQAFFAKGNGRSWFFNSCRKFFGVPDGSFLYSPDGISVNEPAGKNEAYTVDHLIKRFNGHAQEGYPAFQENEKMCGPEIAGMSAISSALLSHINYSEVIATRRSNFNCLHQLFKAQNQFIAIPEAHFVPMVYPLLLEKNTDRTILYNNGFFIPTFWRDVVARNEAGYGTEEWFAKKLLPLPVDHRYDTADMKRMAAAIQSIL